MSDHQHLQIQADQRTMVREVALSLWGQAPASLDPQFAAEFALADDDGARLRVVVDQIASYNRDPAGTRPRSTLAAAAGLNQAPPTLGAWPAGFLIAISRPFVNAPASRTSSASTCSCGARALTCSRGRACSTTRSRRRPMCGPTMGCSTASAAPRAATSTPSCRRSSTSPSSKVELLADRLNYTISYEGSSTTNVQRGQGAAVAGCWPPTPPRREFYAEVLQSAEAAAARQYLIDRNFDADAAKRFGCGFAPSGWDTLTTPAAQGIHVQGAGGRRGLSREAAAARWTGSTAGCSGPSGARRVR